MEHEEIQKLTALLDKRTMTLMERESDLADRMEEIEAQKEELTAAVEELHNKNKILENALTELKERNQELDQILYRASHDLRSPITSIAGILNILEHELSTEIQKKCFEHIRGKTGQMDELLKSLSTLAKTISEDIHFAKINLDLSIRNWISDLRHLPNFSSVEIRTEIEDTKEVTTDRFLLSIIIKNLLTNSITFRDASRKGSVLIRSSSEESGFAIEITDDGEGIADAIKQKVFDMFYRGSELSAGSGLGLYIVKKIVSKLNGQIQFTSGNGYTRFKVSLPHVIVR